MAIEKMKMVNIVGAMSSLDNDVLVQLVDKYLQIENVFNIIEDRSKVEAISSEWNGDGLFQRIDNIVDLGHIIPEKCERNKYSFEELDIEINSIEEKINDILDRKNDLIKKIQEDNEILNLISPMLGMDIDLKRLKELQFIRHKFGKMPQTSYGVLLDYLKDLEAVFYMTSGDRQFVWGIYFTSEKSETKVDSVFASLNFEEIAVPSTLYGTPDEAHKGILGRVERERNEVKEIDDKIVSIIQEDQDKVNSIYQRLSEFQKINEIVKNSARTKETFCIAQWMPAKDAYSLQKELALDGRMAAFIQSPEEVKGASPPTRLVNNIIFKPFQMFIEMYGIPRYKEFDPTVFLALTYVLIFGIMFGDFGQGAILAIGGFILYAVKKSLLYYVVGLAGISSMISGAILYGSVFGIEGSIFKGVISPMERINDVLMYAVYIGIAIIIISMCINIIFSIMQKDVRAAFFGQSGIAGLILYIAILYFVFTAFINKSAVSLIFICIIIFIPLIIVFLQIPLTNLIQRKRMFPRKGIVMFFLESVIEMFEILLSYTTNTMSFIRIGAFALSHAGMMGVVFLLADMVGNGGNIFVYVIGNVVVIALEGLIVGIQVLRLEFFEMFSRFYKGDGKKFIPINEMEHRKMSR